MDQVLRTFLLVEDYEPLCAVLVEWLQRIWPSSIVHEAGSLRSALTILAHVQPSVDLIILDLTLPDATGVSALDAIMASMAGRVPLPVVIFTGSMAHERWSLVSQGADDLVFKNPRTMQHDLIESVRTSWARYCVRQRLLAEGDLYAL